MHSWLLWVLGWICWVAAGYLQFKTAGALCVLGLALTRASGVLPDQSNLASLLTSLFALFKPALVK